MKAKGDIVGSVIRIAISVGGGILFINVLIILMAWGV